MDKKNFKCPSKGCDFVNENLNKVKSHALRRHKIRRLVPCITCKGKLFTYNSLKQHYEFLHVPKKQCKICNKMTRSLSSHLKRMHRHLIGLHEPPVNWKPNPDPHILQRMADVCRIPSKKILRREPIIVMFDEDAMRPVCAFEDFSKESIGDGKDQDWSQAYLEDKKVPHCQITPEVIEFLGYETCQLAAANNYGNSFTTFRETFSITNICPMDKKLKHGIWSSLERHVQNLTQKWQSVRVITGPIYNDEKNPLIESLCGVKVPVPTHFYKIVFMERPGEDNAMQCFILPNETPRHSHFINYRATTEEIEKLTKRKLVDKTTRRMTWDWPLYTPVYKCMELNCYKTYLTPQGLDKHSRVHGKKFCCKVCERSFSSKDKLKKHESGHEVFKCQKDGCTYRTILKLRYYEHVKAHNASKEFKCEFEDCKLVFLTIGGLNRHAKVHEGQRLWKCNEDGCEKDFAHEFELKQHKMKHAGNLPFKCTHSGCDKAYACLRDLNRHLKRHSRPFKCDVDGCNKDFAEKYELQEHKDRHEGVKRFKCIHPGCEAFYSQNRLSYHQRAKHPTAGKPTGKREKKQNVKCTSEEKKKVRIANPKKKWKCEIAGCEMAFSYQYQLKNHEKTHPGNRPFKCEEEGCKEDFSSQKMLDLHKKRHAGEKTFKCSYEGCGEAFFDNHLLRSHESRHAGNRRFKCSVDGCGKDFPNASELQTHMNIHNGIKMQCKFPGCKKEFFTSSGYWRHKALNNHFVGTDNIPPAQPSQSGESDKN